MRNILVKTVRVLSVGVLTLFGAASFCQAEEDVRSRIQSNMVQTKDGKFTIERYGLCRVFRPEKLGGGVTEPFQVRTYVEAPAKGVVSRDYLVSIFTEIAVTVRTSFASSMIKGLSPEEGLAALRCKPIAAPIGTIDFEAKLHMAKDGVQLEILETASGKKEKQTTTWEQMFGQ